MSAARIDGVYDLLGALASVCDNAESRDGSGFSKADLIGHYIYELPKHLYDAELEAISLLMIRKYQSQLVEMGYDVDPYLEHLKELNKDFLSQSQKNRAARKQRRVLVNEEGDFEIYFPTKSSLGKFDRDLPKRYDWIDEIEIPHGYAFRVKRGAREFVASTVEKTENWLIPVESRESLFDKALDVIDVGSAVERDMYITGDSLDRLMFRWKDLRRFLETVKSFSSRSYNGAGGWEVKIATPGDLDLLKQLIESEDFNTYASDEVRQALAGYDTLKAELVKEQESAARETARRKENTRPRCQVSIADGRFRFTFTAFSYSFVDWIKQNLRNRQFHPGPASDAYWTAPCSDPNFVALNGQLDNSDWEFTDEVVELVKSSIELAEARNAATAKINGESFRVSSLEEPDPSFVFDENKINGELLEFQKVVLQYNQLHKNMLIGDDMGLGKSLSSLACAAINNIDDSVTVTCPAIARLTWRDEIQKWLPGRSFYICRKANSKKGALKELDNILSADFVIVSYNKMSVYQDVLAKRAASLFICDESQYVKNPKSQRTKASRNVCSSSEFVYLLSGTALKNRPIELVTQLDMLGVLESGFGGEKDFLFRYCGPSNNGYGWSFNGASNLDELHKRLRETCMVRRLKDDVMKQLPKKLRMRIPVEISNRKEYNKANNDFAATIREQVKHEAEESADQEKLTGDKRKAFIERYLSARVEKAAKAELFVHVNLLRKLVATGLQEAACEWIEDFCESGNPLVVFAYHQDQQKNIYNHLKQNTNLRVGRIVSGMSDEQRKQTEKDFQSGDYDVVVCSIMAANTNITLTASTTVLTLEYLWVPADHTQAEDRCRRIGTSEKAKSIDCYYMHADNTVDDQFWNTLSEKFEIIDQAMDGGTGEGFDNMDGSTQSVILNEMLSKFDFINAKR